MRILTGRHIHINSLRFSSDGRFLVCDGHTPVLREWFVNVWQVHGAATPKHTITGQFWGWDGFTPNNRRLQLHQFNRRIVVSLATGKVMPDAPYLRAHMCGTSPNRQWTVTHENAVLAGVDLLRAVCRVGRRREERWTREFPCTLAPTGDTFDGEEASFHRLAFGVHGTRIFVAYRRHDRNGMDAAIRGGVWPADDRRGWDGRYIFEQEIVWVLDTETGQDVAEWRGEPATLIGPNGELLHLRGPSFQILDTAKLDQPAVTRTNSSTEHFTAEVFSPDGKLLATTSNDTTVTMWDTVTWQPIRQYGWEIGRLRAVAFAPDGLTCAARPVGFPMPTLLSIQIGMPRTHGVPGADDPFDHLWTSGFFKEPVSGPVRVNRLGLVGDGVADRVNHGGPDKAVLAYSADHYPGWETELGIHPLSFGAFGENLSVSELTEDGVCIGDEWECGSVRFEVSQPRQPCWKLARRWRIKDLPARVVGSGRSGWYLRVLAEGEIVAGLPFVLLRRPNPEWTVRRAHQVMHFSKDDPAANESLMAVPGLSMSWMETFRGRSG